MRFWIGTCVILAPTIILPAAMNGWPGNEPKQQLTADQKANYKIAYSKENYFICSESDKNKQSDGCKNAEIIKKVREKIESGGSKKQK